ncbi:MAG: glycogen debranching enzyme family protein [Clostridia bacterium]|nr:glycogen debranching enzyme family protein [Clostridia bacterium]
MKVLKKNLNLEEGLEREWIIGNGIGGYSSSSIIGANTRKYHGLLVASLMPPGRRFVLLSKIDESVYFKDEDKEKILYTNVCKDYISDGYKNLESFEKDYYPVFKYKINGVSIEKNIVMVYGQNTVCVYYKIKTDKDIVFKLAPIMNYRDFHRDNCNHEYNVNEHIEGNKVRVTIDGNKVSPIYMYLKDGKYFEHKNDTFKNMYYIQEEKRGFCPEENLVVPGRYEIEIKEGETKEFTFVCSLESNIEEIDGKKVLKAEKTRLDKIVKDSDLLIKKDKLTKTDKEQNELIKTLVIASDLFIVNRPKFSLHTIIAGYHWFLDWGRDTLISYEGLLLKTKRYEIAKEVLLMFTKDIKFGLVPNGYSGYDSRPLYNSVDSSLLLFEQVMKYIKYTNDYDFVKENLYDVLKNVVNSFKNGIDFENSNISMDKDGLISAGTEETQITWMDAKIGDFAVTPRSGKAVEINSLWYNSLKVLEHLANKFEDVDLKNELNKLAAKVKRSFSKQFYNKEKKCLYDVIGDDKIRPNQLFAISLSYPVITVSSEIAKELFNTVSKELVTKYGIATLSKKDKNYVGVYCGDPVKRDMSYHQGITWPWLTGVYVDAYKNIIQGEKGKTKKAELESNYKKYINSMKKTYKKALYDEAAIGNISEVYDSKSPYNPGGTIAQAWSVSEVLKLELE